MSRLLIFEDGARLSTIPVNSQGFPELAGRLLQTIKRVATVDTVELVDAEMALQNLDLQLETMPKPSIVVDMTGGLMGRHLQALWNVPTLTLGLSRVRKIESRLGGQGFIKRGDWQNVPEVDWSNPLLLDDVMWSGRSTIELMRALNINPESATIANLTTNAGMFGENPGGGTLLQGLGCQIFSGTEVHTPEDDGFHLADFQIPTDIGLEEFLQSFSSPDPRLFETVFTLEELQQLKQRGLFIDQAGLPKNGEVLFGTNPHNLLMPSLQRRINIDEIFKRELFETGQDLSRILAKNREIMAEERQELKSGFQLTAEQGNFVLI